MVWETLNIGMQSYTDRLNRYSTLGKALDSSTGSQVEYVCTLEYTQAVGLNVHPQTTHQLGKANQINDEYYGQRKHEN